VSPALDEGSCGAGMLMDATAATLHFEASLGWRLSTERRGDGEEQLLRLCRLRRGAADGLRGVAGVGWMGRRLGRGVAGTVWDVEAKARWGVLMGWRLDGAARRRGGALLLGRWRRGGAGEGSLLCCSKESQLIGSSACGGRLQLCREDPERNSSDRG
jgi:hypothetical protein